MFDQPQLILLIIKVSSIIFLFTIIIITGNIPIRSKTFNQNKALAAISSAFSGGLFIAVCLLHLLPESCDKFRDYFSTVTDKEVFPYPFLITLSTFALILFIEKIFTNHKHAHEDHEDIHIEPSLIKDASLCCSQQDACCNQVESQLQEEALRKAVSTTMKMAQRVSFFQKQIPKPQRNSLTPILLQIAVGIHAMFEGLAIGIETNVSRCLGIALAVMCHKWAEGLTLGVAFKKAKVPRKTAKIMIFIQAIMNPIGVSVGWILSNGGDVVTGIFYAISAGTFLYISTIEVIVEEFNMARYKCGKYLAFLLAIGFVCGIWFIEQLQLLQ